MQIAVETQETPASKEQDKAMLDVMLNAWARFYLSEFNEVNWARVSMSGKLMEAAELGIFARATKQFSNNYTIPPHIENVINALIELPLIEQHVIKEEYTGAGSQKKKAHRLKMPLSRYRCRLFSARKTLIKII